MDDGKDVRYLHSADIVLVGISRTSKTPLSVLLAYKGYKVANVPLVLNRPPPSQLWEIDQNRVFALTIDPQKLQEIRQQRLKTMRVVGSESYSDMDYILAEVDEAELLFRRNRQWPVINVTNKAVEETAATILAHLYSRGMSGERTEAGQL
jgi:regulator of PEP synthase PpsR (kinase-PPPase family)